MSETTGKKPKAGSSNFGSKGWFIILDDDRKIRKEQSYFIGFDTDVKDKYIN